MSFFLSSDKYQKWRYHIDEVFIIYQSKIITLPSERIKSLTVIHNYEKNLFPIFKLEIALEPSVYYDIIKNKNSVQFKLRVQKYYSEIGSTKKSLYRDWINDTFDLILDDNEYDADENFRKEANNLDYSKISEPNENDMFNKDNIIEFYLFKSNCIDSMNVMVNDVLENAMINDALQYVLSKSSVSRILMAPVDNNIIYKELVIPPLKAKEALLFLDTYYGIYKNGSIVYYDFISNIFYLIPFNGKCNVYQINEIKETNILIPEKSNRYPSEVCGLKRIGVNDINYLIGDNSTITIKNESISLNAYSNTNINLIDSYTGDISTVDTGVLVKTNNTVKNVENLTENQWFSNIYSSLMSSHNLVISVGVGYYDIDTLSPNKQIKVIFENTGLANKYKDNFTISEASHLFIKEGSDFICSTVLSLRQSK